MYPTDAIEDQSAEVRHLRAIAEDACRDADRARQGERARCVAVLLHRANAYHAKAAQARAAGRMHTAAMHKADAAAVETLARELAELWPPLETG